MSPHAHTHKVYVLQSNQRIFVDSNCLSKCICKSIKYLYIRYLCRDSSLCCSFKASYYFVFLKKQVEYNKENICCNTKYAFRNMDEYFIKINTKNCVACSEKSLHKTFLECWNTAKIIQYFLGSSIEHI